ncbi:MAG: 30S ribosomal protein S20 [Proteobacteria bacterium]|nr:30S ribosomal protein S20 [Pseudomonadota bacterium]
MANHKSAIKRARQDEKKRSRNKTVKTQMKNAVKSVRTAAAEKKGDSLTILQQAQAVIDKSAKKGVIHKNAAARKISRLAKLINSTAA